MLGSSVLTDNGGGGQLAQLEESLILIEKDLGIEN